jgi:integrase
MGTVFKKTVTRPLPADATIATKRRKATAKELRKDPHQATVVETIATWEDRSGTKRQGLVVVASDGSQRVRTSSETYIAKYRDGVGIVREVPTGCRDVQAAKAKLAELERTADRVKVGSLTVQDLELGKHSKTPTTEHVREYIAYLRREGRNADRVKTTETRLLELVKACKFDRLADMNADAVLGWLSTEQGKGRSLSVLNGYLGMLVAFGYWLSGKRVRNKQSNTLGEKRIASNPFAGIGKFDEKADRRRQRRALTEDELRRLLFVARWRPIAEYGRTVVAKTGEDLPSDPQSRKTWSLRPLTAETLQDAAELARRKLEGNTAFLDDLDRRGRERALVYKLAVLTGLRRGEIEALTLSHLHLEGPTPFVRMRPQDTKNREAVDVPLRGDLVDDLRQWITAKQNASGVVRIKADDKRRDEPLFNVPRQLVKCLNRDLAAAGIDKVDDRGRTIDVHALRHTFGTLLSRGGVAPRTAQQAMRHSDVRLTMNVYTDPRLLDVAGAVDALPALPIDQGLVATQRDALQATGTESAASFVAPTVAPTRVVLGQKPSIPGTCGVTATSDAKTKKPLGSQGNPRVLFNRAGGIRTHDLYHPKVAR